MVCAMRLTNVWPELELTAEEAQYNAHYANYNGPQDGRPGVLRRTYPIQLSYSNFSGETNKTTVSFIPSGRRTRLFALTFSGDVEWWIINVATQSSERLIDTTQVSALLNLSQVAGAQARAVFQDSATSLQRPNNGPLVFDPNYLLIGSQSIIFTGFVDTDKLTAPNSRSVLNIGIHVWEFPMWGPSGTVPVAPGSPSSPAAGDQSIGGQGLREQSPVGSAAITQARNNLARQFVTKTKINPITQQPRKRNF